MTTTEQEKFWSGEFGDEYSHRNSVDLLPAKIQFFMRAIAKVDLACFGSLIEFGANTGLNLRAMRQVFTDQGWPMPELAAVEINAGACNAMLDATWVDRTKAPPVDISHASILDFGPPWSAADKQFDLALSMGLLIHIAPDDLPNAYDQLYKSSRRYILIAEYYSRQPVEIEYRGHTGRLWKRDFCTEFMERFPDVKRVDYGYVDHHDDYPLDDVHWWLFRKGA